MTLSSDWAAKWPDHCKKCGGWGMHTAYDSVPYGSTYVNMPTSEACDAYEDEKTCHRCGKPGLQAETAEGPCFLCGWNYDDGMPYDEPYFPEEEPPQ